MPAYAAALREGRCGIGTLSGLPPERLNVRTAAQVRGFEASTHFEPKRLAQLDRVSQLALVAGREAWAIGTIRDPTRAGVILGAGIGFETIETSSHALYAQNVKRLPPLTVPRVMPNAPTSHLSIEFGCRGPSFSVSSACASATHAIGLAFHMIRAGLLDTALTGGSDSSFTLGFMKAWEALRVLSPELCRPFSRDRAGLVIGEGAGVLVLEEWNHARARGATVHAEILGFGMSADAGDLVVPDRNGAAQAMRAALADGGLDASSVDYVNAHGTGTRLNDISETAALRDVLGARLDGVPVSSTKSMIGHCLNAAGALELIATILALRDGIIPPTINFTGLDPQCLVDCVPNEARHATINVALSNSFAFGGLNATLAVGRAR